MDNAEFMASTRKRALELSKFLSLYWGGDFDKLRLKGALQPRYVKLFEDMRVILDKVYPGEWDFQLEVTPNFKEYKNTYGYNHNLEQMSLNSLLISKVYVVIHFPTITISNSRKENMELKDLYVRLPIDIYNIDSMTNKMRPSMHTLEGTRTTISLTDYMSGYCHSHLGSMGYRNWNKKIVFKTFCTGNGDINAMKALFNTDATMEIFELLLYQIPEVLKWESLEGGPHIKMESSLTNSTATTLNNIKNDESITVMANIKDKLRTISYAAIDADWKFYNNKYQIIDNERFEQSLFYIARNIYPVVDSSFVVCKDQQGIYYKDNSASIPKDVIKTYTEWLPFRGEKKFFKVEGEIKQNFNKTYYLHPKLKQYVKQRLEYYANSSKVRESAFNKFHQTSNL